MVCLSFIPWKSDGKLSNFHSVYIIDTRFLTFVEISWISNGNRTSFHHVHPSVHSGNYVTSTSDIYILLRHDFVSLLKMLRKRIENTLFKLIFGYQTYYCISQILSIWIGPLLHPGM